MNNSATKSPVPLILFALLASAPLPASGAVFGTHLLNGDGSVTYSYIVDNTGGPFDISAWSLDLDLAMPDWDQLDVFSGGGVDVPNSDWFASAGIPVTGLSAQDFLSLSPIGDVLIGQILGGFSFTSHFLPGTVTYTEFSATGESRTGTTTGPVSAHVPDAGGGLTLIATTALVAFAAGTRRHRAALRACCPQ
ncbi:MAG: hypothetical protein IAE82_04415 [Opitutaceae bacterium]|nr:hypothetical protein [Opitutaceae bacterium]